VSARLCQPCEVILEWIKLYKVHRKPWGLSGSLAIIIDPPAWCGVARTLCARDVKTLFLGGEAPQWRQHQGDQGSLASASVASLCGESSGDLERDLVTGKQYSCVSASTPWTRGGLVPTDTTR
jgi:hypothetical protein